MTTGWEIGASSIGIILFFLYLIYKWFSDEDDYDGFAWSLGSYSKTCEEVQERQSPRPKWRSLESKDNELGCSTVYQDIHTVSGSISYKKEHKT